MKNRELFARDPATSELINNGQARITEGKTDQERKVLRQELTHFVCEGKYEDGMQRMLDSFLGNLNATQQPAAWVSGFYGSGKSHLLKMLHHLWMNTEFEEDGATARTLVPELPPEVEASLRELDTQGRRLGGIHAASGTLPGGAGSVRLTTLGILCRSKELPEDYAQAKFCLYLKQQSFFDSVKDHVESNGKDFFRELNNLYVSPCLHDALVAADPGYGDRKSARELVKDQFPRPTDISISEFISTANEVLDTGKGLPCTILLLDEVQQYIAQDESRTDEVVDMAEALSKEMNSRLLLVGAGQSALGADTKNLTKLMARFTINVELQDQDVEQVTRKVLLQKKPDKVSTLENKLDSLAGEISRQLASTKIGPRTEDRQILTADYPLLPTRRRFWEAALRAVDPSGTSGMLRAQLRLIHDATHEIAEEPLGTVIPGDYIFEQLQDGMVQQEVLLRELNETILNLDDGTPDGSLARRVAGLIFLIRKLPREGGSDLGLRAEPGMLADLLVRDLESGGDDIRKRLPPLLDKLVDDGILLKDHDEYNLQTKQYSEWDQEFRNRKTRIQSSSSEVFRAREALIRDAVAGVIKSIKPLQGESKVSRKLELHFGDDPPTVAGSDIPVWVRDGWNTSEKSVADAALAAGSDSPIIFVYIPKASDDDLRKQIIQHQAAKETLELKGTPTTPEGKEARNAMHSRMEDAQRRRENIVKDIVDRARVLKGGNSEQHELNLEQKVRSAADDALERLFPRFPDADHKNWSVAKGRAQQGSDAPLEAVSWTGPTEQHPVCKEVMRVVGSGAEGREVRKQLSASPYGWPQDAIDAALIVLVASGHLTARLAGSPLIATQLDQTKIARTEFRVETATITAQDKIKLRGLMQEAGLSAKSSDDLVAKSSELLDQLEHLAERAGGEPPLPERPKTTHLGDLRSLAGNERLRAILDQLDTLKANAADWKAKADLAEKRLPEWKRLQRLLAHGNGVDGFDDIRDAAKGIEKDRLLLDGIDHVKPLAKKAAAALRAAVTDAHKALADKYATELAQLEATDAWSRIDAADRDRILAKNGINPPTTMEVGSDDGLLQTLDASPLGTWKDKTDALPARFSTASTEAAKLLEPKTQHVHLASSTLKTEADVKAWLTEQEKTLTDKLKDGPIVIT